MPRRAVAVLCLSFSFLFCAADAHAFWRFIRELSGPGPWVGIDLVFPWSLRPPERFEVDSVNRNAQVFRSFGIALPPLEKTLDDLASNDRHIRLIEDTFNLNLPDSVPRRDLAETSDIEARRVEEAQARDALIAFRRAFGTITLSPELEQELENVDSEAFRKADAEQKFKHIESALMTKINREVEGVTRRFGAGPAGLFGSKQAMPQFADRASALNNWYFSLSLSAALALDNDLRYAEGFTPDRTMLWISAYGAFEYRFWLFDETKNENRNFFVNAGPVFNHFVGDGFHNFIRFSAKSQFGYRIYPFHFGLEFEQAFPAYRPEDFEAEPESFTSDGSRVGLFVSIELVKPRQRSRGLP
jgi:hypothetical protein